VRKRRSVSQIQHSGVPAGSSVEDHPELVDVRRRRVGEGAGGGVGDGVGEEINEGVEGGGHEGEHGNGGVVEEHVRSFGASITRHWDTPFTRKWISSCTSFFSGAKMCAWCGKVHIQPWNGALKTTPPFMGVVPCSVSNPYNLDLCKGVQNRTHWYVCKGCLKSCHDDTPSSSRVHMSSEYISDLLNCPIQELSLLSVLDIGYCLRVKYKGFYNGSMSLDSLINGPIFTWDAVHNRTYYEHNKNIIVRRILDVNIASNPILRSYLTMSEITSPETRVPYISSECVDGILLRH
jgi:hypothetical protein